MGDLAVTWRRLLGQLEEVVLRQLLHEHHSQSHPRGLRLASVSRRYLLCGMGTHNERFWSNFVLILCCFRDYEPYMRTLGGG